MASAEFVNVYPYRDEVVVEITVTDPVEDVAVRSFQFEYRDDSSLSPKGSLGDEFRRDVEEALEDEGFDLESTV